VPVRKGLIAAVATALVFASSASALPPKPPAPAKARTALAHLTVHASLSMTGYSRTKFRHWISQGNGCDTRNRVLIRDGTNVQVGSGCSILSGRWTSFYDGLRFTSATRLDIDHVVPLANAWISGARRWGAQRRQDFANDLTDSQLIAVSASSNRSKGDSGPDAWKPPRRAAWCLYSRWWVQVKAHWKLTVTRPERDALRTMLATC
jgi:hypothetical protein